LKIVIVSAADISGGAAKAAYRLHRALLENAIDSKMVVMKKGTDDPTVFGPISNLGKIVALFTPVVEKLMSDIPYRNKKSMFSGAWISSNNVVKRINLLNPDLVHLHWVNGGMLRIEDLKKLNVPILWNLQDMWPFTGGCHFNDGCLRYELSCGSCKALSSRHKFDVSSLIHSRKLKSYNKIEKLVVNGVSKWIANCARDSSLFKRRKVFNIPNAIDSDLFRPLDKKLARQLFKLPQAKKVVLFGASNVNDRRKGYIELLSSLGLLDYENLILVIAGQSAPKKSLNLKFQTYYIPAVQDDVSLALMYNVADVVVVPSIEENLSNMILESMSCGVPVVAFDIGGNGDMIEHKHSGYLVKAHDQNDMAHGISWMLDNGNSAFSQNAREKVLRTFSYSVVVDRYVELYGSIL
jgi:glycosyltransferase involved in cell wall biosynthesis